MHNLEEAIRERAYHLWIADGRREGNADIHWLDAQRQVLAAALGTFARVTDDMQTPRIARKKPVRKTAARGKRRVA